MGDEFDGIDLSGGSAGNIDLGSFDTEFGLQGPGIDSLQSAINANSLSDVLAGMNFDQMDLNGNYESLNGGFDLGSVLGGSDVTKNTELGNWQQVGNDRILVDEDGSALLMNENGDVSSLTAKEVEKMGEQGILNSASSGYNAATGGNQTAPGGGKTTVNADGTKTVVMPDGKTFTITKDGSIVPGPSGTSTTPNTTKTPSTTKPADDKKMDPMTMMLLLYLLSQAGKTSGSGSQATIPALSANRTQLPYSKPSRPGAGGQTYFSPTTYTPQMAGGIAGGMAGGGMATGGISTLGGYSDGGRLLKGPGDGVSDSIPATIGGNQKAALADGEFVVPARIVSELGNGSTDAGARKLYAMMDRVQQARRKTKNVAADTRAAKHLPA
jgi:hypothetical protein